MMEGQKRERRLEEETRGGLDEERSERDKMIERGRIGEREKWDRVRYDVRRKRENVGRLAGREWMDWMEG